MIRRAPGLTGLAAIAIASAIAAGACKGKGHAMVEGVLVPQADGVIDPPAEGAVLAIQEGTTAEPPLPAPALLKIAIARKVKWSFVKPLYERAEKAEKQVLFLVGRVHRVKALQLEDAKLEAEHPIRMHLTADGKACVQAPGVDEAKCVQSPDASEIDASGVRELVREAVQVLDLRDVLVYVSPELPWDDVVRGIDAARTCCREEVVRVRIADE